MEIYTNMDTKKQEGVNNVMNEKTYTWPKNKPTLQAGVAAVESTSGKILAIGSARNRKGERVLSYATDIITGVHIQFSKMKYILIQVVVL